MARPPSISRYGRGKAYIRLRIGGDEVPLGRADDDYAWRKGRDLIYQWEQAGRVWPLPGSEDLPTIGHAGDVPTMAELGKAFEEWAEAEYTGGHFVTYKMSMAALAPWFDLRADQFRAPQLAAYRDRLPKLKGVKGKRYSFTTMSKLMSRVRQMARWAEEKGYNVPRGWGAELGAVRMFRRDRKGVKRTDPVRAVSQSEIDSAKRHLRPIVADMVDVQALTGMRSSELLTMKAIDISMKGKVWQYRPAHHKTAHHGHERIIDIGPRAQEIIKKHLDTDADVTLPIFLSRGGKKYTPAGYRASIRHACSEAKVEPWTPHQLRHTFATRVRAEAGYEAARVALGHNLPGVTAVYAEASRKQAEKVILKIG